MIKGKKKNLITNNSKCHPDLLIFPYHYLDKIDLVN